MRLKSVILVVSLSTALAVACNNKDVKASPATAQHVTKPAGAGTVATPTAAPAKRKSKKQYAVVVRPVTMKVGSTHKAKMIIEPSAGLKFNKDFPSSFIVSAGRHASCETKKLSKKTGHVKVEGKKGAVTVPLKATAAGTGALSIIGNFSVCSEEQCYVLRGEKLALNVTVQ